MGRLIRRSLLAAADSTSLRSMATKSSATRRVLDRFVAGESNEQALSAANALTDSGLFVTIDHLGESVTRPEQAARVRDSYVSLLGLLAEHGLGQRVEVSLKLSALGQFLPVDGERLATDNGYLICEAASAARTTVTLDMEDHTTVDSTLAILSRLRAQFPSTGAVLQAYLHRTYADCQDLAHAGSRVRLCKGAYREPASVALQARQDVSAAYVRCLEVLMQSGGYPMVASHDPQMIEQAHRLAAKYDRGPSDFEYQMLFGIRVDEQRRLAREGAQVRVYLPYGEDWWGYLVRRLAEKPSNLSLFLRSLPASR